MEVGVVSGQVIGTRVRIFATPTLPDASIIMAPWTRRIKTLAEAVLRPRPGGAICSFWQGNIEIAGRIIAPLVHTL